MFGIDSTFDVTCTGSEGYEIFSTFCGFSILAVKLANKPEFLSSFINASTFRTDNPSVKTISAACCCIIGFSIAKSGRACPKVSLPFDTRSLTGGVNFNKRSIFEICERLLPILTATTSCVCPNSFISLSYACASSITLRFSR